MNESLPKSLPSLSRMGAAPTIEEAAALQRTVLALDPAGPPEAHQVCGAALDGVGRLVVLPGSFNPPHAAHAALLAAGIEAVRAEAGAYLLSARTVDKEHVTGMLLEDRLWLLCRLSSEERGVSSEESGGRPSLLAARYSTLVANRGLYVDIATAVRRRWANVEMLWFVVGYDKIVQIFDPRYYQDRDAALDALFGQAGFLVAPRDRFTLRDVAALLDRPENRRYAGGVTPLPLDPALAGVSSTRARERAGRIALGDEALPEVVRHFIAATGCYGDEAAYGARAGAIEAATSRASGS